MSSAGSINAAKSRLIALLKLAIPEYGLITGDWRVAQHDMYSVKTGPKLPSITVRVNPARVVPTHYSRLWAGSGDEIVSGDVGIYSFSAHCFHSNCTAAGEEKYAHAQNLADRVMQYLSTQTWSPDLCDYCIFDVQDLTARESEPKGGNRKVSRVIVEGTLMVKRED